MATAQPSVTRKYNRSIHTEDIPLGQKPDLDISIGQTLVHGEALPNVVEDTDYAKDHLAKLAFNEEPVTIIIEENQRADFPETSVPVAVNGKGAEMLINGKWVEVAWLPIGRELTTKRKYAEVLMYSKSDSIKTEHDDATVERPRNTLTRRTSANYPITILEDRNPLGREWVTRIRQSF